MKIPGENQPTSNESDVSMVENQESAMESRQLFGRIGHKITAILNNANERRHERQVLATVAEIERLSNSEDERDHNKLSVMRQEVDMSDDRIFDAVLDSYDSFEHFSLEYPRIYLETKAKKEKLFENKHLKTLAMSHFEEILIDKKTEKTLGNFHEGAGDNASLLTSFLENMFDDEDNRKKIVEKVGARVINESGDDFCRGCMKNPHVTDNDELEAAKKRIGLFKQLGYDYFRSDVKNERAENLLGDSVSCYVLEQFGLMDSNTVSTMYDIKSKKISNIIDEASQQVDGKINREDLEKKFFIPDWLVPDEGDKMAEFWREQNEKCGFDAMILVADVVARKHSAGLLENGLPIDDFFNSDGQQAFLFTRQERFSGSKTQDDLIIFFANNLDRIEDDNTRWFVSNYAKIKGAKQEEIELARLQYKNMIQSNQSSEKGVKLFDEYGTPTENFYDLICDCGYHPKFLPYIDGEWRKHFSKEQLSMIDFKGEFPNEALETFKKINKNNISDYFDENGPKQEFWQTVLEKQEFSLLFKQAEEIQQKFGFSPEIQQFLKLFRNNDEKSALSFLTAPHTYTDKDGEIKTGPWTENIPDYFDENGPKQEFWLELFSRGEFDFVLNQDMDKIPVSDEQKKLFFIFRRLKLSNSTEIAKHYKEFNTLLRRNYQDDIEKMQEAVDEIEGIFLRSGLPYVGKVFKTFRVLYPEDSYHMASAQLERGALKGLPEKGVKSKNAVIFNDLLRASIGSNNRNLKKYLTDLIKGQDLVERINNGETNFSQENQDIASNYSKYLITLYDNTQAGSKEPFKPTSDTIENIKKLSRLFAPTERYRVPDRVVRSFGFGLGIKSCKEMLGRINETAAIADARNRITARSKKFKLESGDLIKSTGIEYLGTILQNGSLSKEFLNGSVSSDSTPLDTDLNILPIGLSGNISEGVDVKNKGAAFGKMHCMMVLKGDANSGRQRFYMEGEASKYDRSKYEIWDNGGINYGIRVGFPSTEIDYFIYDDLERPDQYGDLETMKFEIARNGFYIPIVDKSSGELVFSPENYDYIRQRMRGLKEYQSGSFRFADEKAWGADNHRLVLGLDIPAYKLPNGEIIPSITEIAQQSEQNAREVAKKRGAILEQVILPIIKEMGLQYKDHLDSDITPGFADIIDTGSTGRLSNIPGAGDFDFMMEIDREILTNKDRMEKIRSLFKQKLGDQFLNGNVRAKNVKLDDLDVPVEIDVTFGQRTNDIQYSTDIALKEWYRAIEATSPEKARKVYANVVFAKMFFKGISTYKSRHANKPQGGLGGVGIENWILQNGGSFMAAAKDFMSVASSCSSFEEFKGKYAIFDFGENHKDGRHDNFIAKNIDPEGYERIKNALSSFLEKYDERP